MKKEKPISIGVFTNHEQANRALIALERSGFDKDQIGYIAPRGHDLTGEITDETPSPTSIAAGAVGGGVVGRLLGTGTCCFQGWGQRWPEGCSSVLYGEPPSDR